MASRFLIGDVVGFWMAHLGFAQSTPWTDEVAVVSSDWYALMVKPHNITAGSSSRLAAAAVGYCTRGRRSVWDSKVVVVPVHDEARLHWCLLVIYAADFDGTGPASFESVACKARASDRLGVTPVGPRPHPLLSPLRLASREK